MEADSSAPSVEVDEFGNESGEYSGGFSCEVPTTITLSGSMEPSGLANTFWTSRTPHTNDIHIDSAAARSDKTNSQ
ncbi:hypothetical protein BGX26_004705, partial [Mortierella sp. AD094]